MKREFKHTPGPWHVLPDPVWKDKHPLHEARFVATSTDVEVDSDGTGWTFTNDRDVIICTMPDSPHQKGNAQLIASAPELLEALKRLTLAWSSQPLMITHDDGERLEAMQNACEVIGKATGEPYSPSENVRQLTGIHQKRILHES